MNESGRAVKPLMEYYDIALDDLIVVSDDLDMPVGKIKLKQRGASGGHNGLKSLIDHLGTREFNRVKLGIDHPKFGSVVSHVLGRFDTEERPVFEGAVLQAEQALIKWVQGTSFDQLMNEYN